MPVGTGVSMMAVVNTRLCKLSAFMTDSCSSCRNAKLVSDFEFICSNEANKHMILKPVFDKRIRP